MALTSIEICADAGGRALGLGRAGFAHVSRVELDPAACQTLRINRNHWHVTEGDLRHQIQAALEAAAKTAVRQA